jgi:putative DNA methylase
MIEIPSIFNEQPPIGPIHSKVVQGNLHEEWKGSKGMAEDVRRYGAWMRDEAINRIGHLYPLVDVDTGLPVQPEEKKKNQNVATVMAWLWARTVKSPNPAFSHVDVPLATTFVISNKVGKEIYVEPIIENDTYHFVVRNGKPSDPAKVKKGTKLARGANFYCVLSDTPIDSIYIKAEAKAGRMGARLLVVVAEGQRGRLYISPTSEMESVAFQAQPNWKPEIEFAKNSRHMTPWVYGLDKFSDLFSARQLLAINTFSEIINDVKEKVKKDALASGMEDDGKGLNSKGSGATAYADAIAVYLAFALDKMIDRGSTVCSWDSSRDSLGHTFGRQAISMVWDYSEANFFSDSSGSINNAIDQCVKSLEQLQAHNRGEAHHINAQSQSLSQNKVISSDPPYYDNVPYADLSDFFYVWLRRSLKSVYPDLFASIVVPKMEELVADPFRHNNKDSAESFFLEGMTKAMNNLANKSHPAFPVTIYYAFKQSETSDVGTSSTGWETFLEAVIRAGFCITGTWPFRTELGNRIRGQSSNALASSIVLVCRKREADSVQIARRDFLRELKEHLPETLVEMIGGKIGSSPIAPVDLAQAAIGPGMAIYSNYAAILESDGSPMTVHSALQLINKEIDDYFGGQTFDEDTNFCIS